jgi:hypothetical protein
MSGTFAEATSSRNRLSRPTAMSDNLRVPVFNGLPIANILLYQYNPFTSFCTCGCDCTVCVSV